VSCSARQQDWRVWPRREPPLDTEMVNGIIRMLMQIDAKLDQIRERLEIDDEEEEEDDA
jgi:hypothetical protein